LLCVVDGVARLGVEEEGVSAAKSERKVAERSREGVVSVCGFDDLAEDAMDFR